MIELDKAALVVVCGGRGGGNGIGSGRRNGERC